MPDKKPAPAHPLARLAQYLYPPLPDAPQDPNAAHPSALRNGLIERAIKSLGANFGALYADDLPYLEQYFHPEVDILPRSDLRPTVGGTEGMVVRQPLAEYESEFGVSLPAPAYPGLGNYTNDYVPDRGYRRIEDIWDFDTEAQLVETPSQKPNAMLESLARYTLRKAGTPYVLRENQRTRDIELPTPKKSEPKKKK